MLNGPSLGLLSECLAIGTVDNVLYSNVTKNILITINPTHKNKMFYYSMLRLSKLNMIILFINFLFKKQSEGVRIDLENFEIEAERIKCKYSIQSSTGGWEIITCIKNICILRNPTERT